MTNIDDVFNLMLCGALVPSKIVDCHIKEYIGKDVSLYGTAIVMETAAQCVVDLLDYFDTTTDDATFEGGILRLRDVDNQYVHISLLERNWNG